MRVVVRLVMNLLVRAHTGDAALVYKDNRAVYRFKHRLALFIDEYPQLGRQEQFVLSLAAIRSFGIWPILGVQVPSQLKDVGNQAAITGMCKWKIILTPNDHESATWAADEVGKFTGENVNRSFSGSRIGWKMSESVSVAPVEVYMVTPGEFQDLPPHHAIGRFAGMPPVRLETVFFEDVPELKRRAYDYPPPEISDVIPFDPVAVASAVVREAAYTAAMHDAARARIAELEQLVAQLQQQTHATSTSGATPTEPMSADPAAAAPAAAPPPPATLVGVAATATVAGTAAAGVGAVLEAVDASAEAKGPGTDDDLDFFALADEKRAPVATEAGIAMPNDVDDLLRERDDETNELYAERDGDEPPSDDAPEELALLDDDATLLDPLSDALLDDYDHN
jgi:hypothetical protein